MSGPASGLVCAGMALVSAAAAPAGMLSAQNDTLCGGPETIVQRTPSPALMVRLAGSYRYPLASPSMRTSCIVPVIAAEGADGAAPGAGVVAAGVAAAAG